MNGQEQREDNMYETAKNSKFYIAEKCIGLVK